LHTYCSTPLACKLQHTTCIQTAAHHLHTHCSTPLAAYNLQHTTCIQTAAHHLHTNCSTPLAYTLQHTTCIHICSILPPAQQPAACCLTLQHTAAHSSTLQHTTRIHTSKILPQDIHVQSLGFRVLKHRIRVTQPPRPSVVVGLRCYSLWFRLKVSKTCNLRGEASARLFGFGV